MKLLISILLVGLCVCINAVIDPEAFTTGNAWLDTLLGMFIRLNEYSYFPFISWIVYPVAGFGIAFFFRRYGMKKTLIFFCIHPNSAQAGKR